MHAASLRKSSISVRVQIATDQNTAEHEVSLMNMIAGVFRDAAVATLLFYLDFFSCFQAKYLKNYIFLDK